MNKHTPQCPLCGWTTVRHCRYCSLWMCLFCDVQGDETHMVPRGKDPMRENPEQEKG